MSISVISGKQWIHGFEINEWFGDSIQRNRRSQVFNSTYNNQNDKNHQFRRYLHHSWFEHQPNILTEPKWLTLSIGKYSIRNVKCIGQGLMHFSIKEERTVDGTDNQHSQ